MKKTIILFILAIIPLMGVLAQDVEGVDGTITNDLTVGNELTVRDTTLIDMIEAHAPAGFSVTSEGDNRLITSDGSGGGVAEQYLTFSGSTLSVLRSNNSGAITMGSFSGTSASILSILSSGSSFVINSQNGESFSSGQSIAGYSAANPGKWTSIMSYGIEGSDSGTLPFLRIGAYVDVASVNTAISTRPVLAGYNNTRKQWEVSAADDWDYQDNNLLNIDSINADTVVTATLFTDRIEDMSGGDITLVPGANVNISSGALELGGTERISSAGVGTFASVDITSGDFAIDGIGLLYDYSETELSSQAINVNTVTSASANVRINPSTGLLSRVSTGYYSLSAAAFKSRESQVDVVYTDSGTENLVYFPATGGDLISSVELPHGVTITAVVVYGADVTDTWTLSRSSVSSSADTSLATAVIGTEDTTITSGTVDNSLYVYYLRTSTLGTGTGNGIFGARITYTY